MLFLPCDSGYNSPCDGIAPSSLYFTPGIFLRPDVNSEVRRRLQYESHICWNSRSSFPPSESSNRSREIARRLIQLCDSFAKEFAESSEIAEDLTWTASISRLIGF